MICPCVVIGMVNVACPSSPVGPSGKGVAVMLVSVTAFIYSTFD